MAIFVGRLFLLLSLILLAYVFLAGAQYKALLREDLGVNFVMSLPVDVYIAAVFSFVLSILGAVLLADGFKSVYSADDSPLKCVVGAVLKRAFVRFRRVSDLPRPLTTLEHAIPARLLVQLNAPSFLYAGHGTLEKKMMRDLHV